MTTPYSVSVGKGSASWSSYVNAPINGPLSHFAPLHMPYHSYGILPFKSTPQQFYPAQQSPLAELNTNARYRFLRTIGNPNQIKDTHSTASYAIKSAGNKQVVVSTHMNYIAPIPSSMRTSIVQSNAVGKSTMVQPISGLVSTKSYYPSGTRSSLRRVRSGGCVAPKKKGAIENTSLRNGQVCAWGSIVRQNY